jgi:hypothetical protein
MGTVIIVVTDVLGEHRHQLALAQDQRPVEALAAYRADPALGDRVRPRRLRRRLDHRDGLGGEYRIEGCGELAVPVSYQEP